MSNSLFGHDALAGRLALDDYRDDVEIYIGPLSPHHEALQRSWERVGRSALQTDPVGPTQSNNGQDGYRAPSATTVRTRPVKKVTTIL